jgi:crooked neck
LTFTLIDWDILFADDEREANPATFKFIQNALAWRNKEGGAAKGSMLADLLQEESDSESGDESDQEENEDDKKSSSEGDHMRD